MIYDYSKLKGRIIEKFGSNKEFARAIPLSMTSLSKKLTGKVGLKQDEIIEWSRLLNIPPEEYRDFFLCPKS